MYCADCKIPCVASCQLYVSRKVIRPLSSADLICITFKLLSLEVQWLNFYPTNLCLFNIFTMFNKISLPPSQQTHILSNMNLSYSFTTVCFINTDIYVKLSMY